MPKNEAREGGGGSEGGAWGVRDVANTWVSLSRASVPLVASADPVGRHRDAHLSWHRWTRLVHTLASAACDPSCVCAYVRVPLPHVHSRRTGTEACGRCGTRTTHQRRVHEPRSRSSHRASPFVAAVRRTASICSQGGAQRMGSAPGVGGRIQRSRPQREKCVHVRTLDARWWSWGALCRDLLSTIIPPNSAERLTGRRGLQTDPEAVARAQKHKGDGNASFAAGKYEEAINHFTLAILEDGADAVFYSNRSACYAALKQFDRAADDGQKCIDIKKDWPKGYSRLALARFRQGNYAEAQKVYNAGLNQEPGNAALKEGACCPSPSCSLLLATPSRVAKRAQAARLARARAKACA